MLLSNWLGTITSRIKNRPLFRSRDRRAIRKRWQSIVHNQISTTELLEDRTLLTTITGTTPDGTGTLDVDETSLEVTFSETVNGADVAANYMLVRAGVDGLLGSADDVVITIDSASYSGGTNTATLNFAALSEDIYRLMVFDTITNVPGDPLDGDGDGSDGGNFTGDFVVGATSPTLTSPGGETFDPETTGFGAGQLVQGSNNAFDGLNRLQVDGTDFSPMITDVPLSLNVQETTSTVNGQSLTPGFATIPGLTLTAAEAGVYQISGEFGIFHNSGDISQVEYRFLINGVAGESRITTLPTNSGGHLFELNLEDTLELNAGNTVQFQVRLVTGNVNFSTNIHTQQHRLSLTRLEGVTGLNVQQAISTVNNAILSSSFVTPSGMGTLTATESGVYQIAGELGIFHNSSSTSQVEYRILINGVAGESRITTLPSNSAGRFFELNLEDTLELNAGNTVQLQVRMVSGGASLFTTGYTPQHRLSLTQLEGLPGLTVQQTISTIIGQGGLSGGGFVTPSGMGTLTATESGVYQIAGEIGIVHLSPSPSSQVEYRFLINGVAGESRITLLPTNSAGLYFELNLEDTLELNAGNTVQLQIRLVTGGSINISTSSYTPQHRLSLTRFDVPTEFQLADGGRTVVTNTQNLSGLDVHREVTVPSTGGQDFARTVDVFHNPTGASITETVTIVGNLGSDGETVVFKTSDGDSIVETSDLWIGTDDADGTGTPAIIHYIHGPQGLIPATVEVVGDNIVWTYDITVNAGETVRLAYLTILADTRANAEAAADALVSSTGFTGEAGTFLTGGELASLQNFQFNPIPANPPGVVYVDSNFINPVPGQDPDGAGSPATQFGFDAFATIQEAIDAVADGGTIHIATGIYAGNVNATTSGTEKSVRLAPGSSPGQVVITGDLILDGDDRLEIEINGTVAGTGFDQFIVNGDVTLGGAALTLTGSHNPVEGDRFMLIDNNLADTVTGIFSGFPEGYEFTDFLGVMNLSAYLTYAGGDGNDVVIVVEDSNPVVTLPSDSGSSEYSFAIVNGNVVITDVGSGKIISATPLDALQGILVINGEDDQNDTLSIDMTGINHTTPLQIQFNGGTGGFDTLELLGGSLDTVEHFFTSNSSGSVQLNGSMTDFVTYTGLEPIYDGTVANDKTFSFLGGTETITLSDDVDAMGGAIAGRSQIDSDVEGEITFFVNPLQNLIIKTTDGTGADQIHIEGVDANFDANLTVQAGVDVDTNNDDSVTFQTAATSIISGNLDIAAGSIALNAAVTTSGAVSLNATNGSITGTSLVTAANAHLEATGNVGGSGTEVELAVGGLEADVDGSLYVDNTGALNIGFGGTLTGVMVGGASTITSTGTMTVTEDVTGAGGTLKLENTGGDFVVNSPARISNTGAFLIDIDSAGAVTLNDGSGVASLGTGLVDIVAATNVALSTLTTGGNLTVDSASVNVANGATVTAAEIDFDAATVGLDGDLVFTSLSGNASTVNVLGSAGGAEIQDAIDLAASGATINIAAGEYTQAGAPGNNGININKSVTLIGAGADENPGVGTVYAPVGEGAEANESVINITATDVTIRNIFVDGFKNLDSNTGQSYSRIFMSTADRTTIEDVAFQNYVTGGIELNGSNDSVIRNVTTFGVDPDGAYTPLDIGFGTSQDGIRIVDAEGVTIKDFSADTVEYGIIAFQGPTSFSVDNVSITNAEFGISVLTQSFNYGGGAFVRFGGQQDVTIDGAVNLTNVDIGFRLVDLTNDDSGMTDTVTGLPGGPGSAPDINLILTGNESFSLNNVTIPVQRQGEGSVPNLANFVDGVGLDAVSTDFDTSGLPQGEWYFVDPFDAVAKVAAEAVNPLSAVVQEISSTDYYVGPGMAIQPAIDDAAGGESVRILTGSYAGNVDAGSKAVTLHPGTSPGLVTINGNLTLDSDDTLVIELDGSAAGTGYDQIDVTGAVTIGAGATLNLTGIHVPAAGEQYVLIKNDGVDPIVGTFAGFEEGHEFENFLGVLGQSAFLTYVGGDGNDLVLVVEDASPLITLPDNDMVNQYTLRLVGDNVILTDDDSGDVLYNAPLAAVQGPLVINGEDGENDTLSIDMTGINHTTPLQIQFNGGTGGFDTLGLLGGSLDSVEHFFTSNSSGSVQLNGSGVDFVRYSGLEPVVDTIAANDRTFSFTGGAETITLSDDTLAIGGPVAGRSQIVSDLFGEVVYFLNPANNIFINTGVGGGSGVDTVVLDSVDSTFDANITVTADSDDTVTLSELNVGIGNSIDLSVGFLRVNGTGSGDTLTLNASSQNAGNLQLNSASTVNFADLTEFEFNGLFGADIFYLNNPVGDLFEPVDGITFNGGVGGETAFGDNLFISEGIADTVEHRFFTDTSGSVFYNVGSTAAINYTGLDSGFAIVDQIDVVDRILTFTSVTDEEISLGDAEFGVGTIVNSTAGAALSFSHPTGSVTINSNVGADTLEFVSHLGTGFDADLTINGGSVEVNADVDLGSGDLDINGSQFSLMGDLTTTGGIDIQETGSISFGAANSLNAGNGISPGTSNVNLTGSSVLLGQVVTDGDVSVTATSGLIYDSNGGANDITANRASLEAATGIITIQTQVNTLAASSVTGEISITNTGSVIIDTVGSVSGLSTGNGGISLIAMSGSSITVNQSVSATGFISLGTGDSTGDEDLVINAGITSSADAIELIAGDDLTIATGVTVNAATELDLFADTFNNGENDTEGSIISLFGILQAGTDIEVRSGFNDDRLIIDSNGGSLTDSGTVDGVQAAFLYRGSLGEDTLSLDDSGDLTGDTIDITDGGAGAGTVSGLGSVVLSFASGLDHLEMTLGSGADDVTVMPNLLTTIDIAAGDPTTSPGDSLDYVTPAGEGSNYTPTGTDSGVITATGGYEAVTFDDFEDMLLEGSVTVTGTVGNDVLTITATDANTGSYQINGGLSVTLASITDFTFNGGDGDDTLIINNPAGSLFNPVDGIFFNGEGQDFDGDSLQILGGEATTVEHEFKNASDGFVLYNGSSMATITYTGLEPILDTIAAMNRTFTFTGGTETITLEDVGGANDHESRISSSLGEAVTFNHNPLSLDTVTIDTTSDSDPDTVDIVSLDGNFDANLIVTASATSTINTGTVDIGSGALDLTAGQINVNGAFTTTGSVDINANAFDITFGAAGSINAGASDIDLTAFFNVESLNVTTASEVRVTATNGGINDLINHALITADRVALDAETGITGIETNVNTLAASTTSGGFSIDNTGALEIGTVDLLSGITAAASSIFLTTTGTLLVSDAVTGGAVDLRSNDTMTISDDVAASTGTLKLQNNGGDFVVNSPALVSNTGAFLIDIDSAGAVTLDDGSEVASLGTGLIDIVAATDVALSTLTTGGNVTVTATTGAITDNNGALNNISAVNATLTSGGSTGAGDALETTIAALEADSGGFLGVANTGALNIGFGGILTGVAADAGLTITSTGTMTVTESVTGSGGTLKLENTAGDFVVNSPALVSNTGAFLIDIDSAGAVTLDDGSGVMSLGAGLIDIVAATDVALSTLTTGGNVTVTATTGAITDNNGALNNISAVNATLTSGGSTGAGDALETTIAALEADSGGFLGVVNTGALNIGFAGGGTGVVADAGLTITSTGTMTVTESVTGSGGTLKLENTAGDFVVNSPALVSNTGAFLIDIDSAGAVTLDDGSGVMSLGAGLIDIVAATDVALSTLTTGGNVTVTATTGAITDNNGALNNISAVNATLTSGGSTGAGDALETTIAALEADSGAGLELDNTGALNIGFGGILTGVAADAGLTITSTGTMTVTESVTGSGGTLKLENTAGDFVVNSPALVSNTGAFLIDIDSAGAVTLDDGSGVTSLGAGLIDIVAATDVALSTLTTGGNVTVTATTGAITDNNGALNNISAVNATLTSGGSTGAGDALETTIAALEADSGGFLGVANTGALNIGFAGGGTGVAADAGLTITSTGTMTVTESVTGSGGTLKLENTAGDFVVNSPALVSNTGAFLIDIDSAGAVTLDDGSGVMSLGAGLIDIVAATDVALSTLTTGGNVTVTATAGAITDNNDDSTNNIAAVNTTLISGTGTGDGNALETTIAALEASSGAGLELDNTGALNIGLGGVLTGVMVGGDSTITSTGIMTVTENVIGAGTVTLTASDSAAVGDNLTILLGVTVRSTGMNVVLTAGDNFVLDDASSIIALTTIEINVDPSAGDPDVVGGILNLFGSISAAGGTTLRGGDDNDTFNVLPSTTSTINVIGGDPTLPTIPGDILNLDFSDLTSSPFLTLGMAAGSGAFGFLPPDTEQTVTYSSIENVITSGSGSYHLVLDMADSGFEDTAADTIDAALDAGGTDLVLDINMLNFFTGAVADILSFTVLGSTDSDTLNINESAGGMLNFTTAAPAGIPDSMGSHLNAAADFFLEDIFNPNTYDANDITIHYDGGTGMGIDRVNVNFITNHDAGYFSDVDDAPFSGNIVAAATGDTDIDLGLSFGNVEGVGIFGTTAGGGLRVDASSTPATTQVVIDDAAGAGISQIMANGGFANLLFSGFHDLQVVSGDGGELIDLIALDAASSLTDIELDADDVFGTNSANVDTIRVRSTPASVTSINILAAAGNDLIQIFDAGNTVNNINGAITVDGEGGNDTLTIIDSGDLTGDAVVITSTTVDGLFSAAGADITFADIDDLNVTVTSGNDTIDVSMTDQEDLNNVTINGAPGNDDFNLNNSTPMGVDTRLNGNLGNDNFVFLVPGSVLRGFINGGGNSDTIDYTTYAAVVHVALSGLGTVDGFQGRENNGSILGTVGTSLGFDNIDNLIGSAGSDTLQGANLNNYWGIITTDNGLVIADRANLASGRPTTGGDLSLAPGEQRINFASFQNLIGGTLDDRFDLSNGAGLSGNLDGSTGNDSLDYRDYATGVNVNLFTGIATNIGGNLLIGSGGDDDNSIENVFGGNGNDIITGDNDNNILGDGFGNDFLDGGGDGVGSENGGNDVFLMEPGNAGSADVITDIHGNDTIDFRFASTDIVFDVDIINAPQIVLGTSTVELRQIQPQQPDTNPSFMENIVGSEFNDLIFIDPLSQDGNFPIDGPPVLRSADGRGGFDVLDFDAKGQAVIDTGFSLTADGVGTVQYLNFENVNPFEDSPAFIVDNGDAAFTITGDWPYHPHGTAAITNGIGFENDIHTVAGSTPTGNGPAQAFWEFFGLTPGVYRVSVTWPVSTNPAVVGQVATDAPFTVFDGARTDVGTSAVNLATVDLNQQLAPDDFTADGAVWEDLGIFTINGRTLTVMLTNLADGKVTADAIRIERVSTGAEVELTDTTDLVAPPTIVVDGQPGGIQFGATELLTPAVRTFRIANTGSVQLDISNVVIPAGYSVLGLPASVAAGSFADFTITMDASSFGDRSGIFSFDTNDVDEATFNILLDGRVSNVVIIDDGDTDFTATPGFENFPTGINAGFNGYEGDVTGAVPNQPGNTPAPAAATATWTFNGLVDGNYRVSTTWSPSYNRVDDAPYSLNGGAAIDVDQRVYPSSFTEDGVAWFDLDASFAVVGGVLTVTLTNDANSFPRDAYDLANGVIADAIRIEYLPEPDIQVTVDGGTLVNDDTGIVDFGSTLPGIPVSKTFTITNLSAADVNVTGLIEFPPGFSIDPASPFGTTNAPVIISGGGSVTFIVQFDGGTTGSTFGQISFTTGDPDENPYNFTVTGTAGPATVEITDTVDFSTIGTWSEHTPGSIGDPEFLYAGDYHTGGTGANSATWSFDVEPGRYQVVAHWYVHPDITPYGRGAASNAPYTIFDNVTPVTTVLMNQQANPDDFLNDGTFWEYIGDPVEITSSMLNVFLSDNANGIVYADEVRIYRVVDPIIKVEVDGETVADGGVVDFEETIEGAPVAKTFTVTNYGERNMALGGIISVPAGFTLLAPLGNTNLAPGASTSFTLQMNAGSSGSFSGMVMFGVDSQDANPFNFTVSGTVQDHMIVDNGDLNYSTSGPWETRTAATIFDYFQDDQDLLTGDLGGTNTATWQFTNLAAGTYRVGSTWSAHSSMASNAAFTISGIEGGSQTVTLDQRFAANDFVSDGANWEQLGYFQVSAGGTLTITLTDDGANGYLAADAMLLALVPIGSLAPEIDVQVGATALTSGVSGVDFGTAFFGESVFQTVTVTNSGTATLNLGAINVPAGFTVSTPPGDATLAAGQSTTFVLEFNSIGAPGAYAGAVTIASDDADENPFTFNVSATMVSSIILDDGEVGFNSSGNFFTYGSPFYYGEDSQRLNTGGTGTATWDFTGLTAGTYQVSTTWNAHATRDSSVDYNVTSSGMGGGATAVSQRVAPNSFTADGTAWEILGTVTVGANGTITVTLSDTAIDGSILADAVRIERTGPLVAAAGTGSGIAPVITQTDLNSVRDAALNYWAASGLSETQLSLLQSVSFVLSDLPDAMLGGATSTTIMIDINAAGYGWFVDDTPFDSSEFTLDANGNLIANEMGAAFGRMDLLTVVMHELGHTLGYDHEEGDGLMGESLNISERRLPVLEDAAASDIDDFFSSIAGGENPLLD